MIQHFQFRSLYKDSRLPGWIFSFYYYGQKMKGIYHQDGKIEWSSNSDKMNYIHLEKQVHDLMIFHVYDKQ